MLDIDLSTPRYVQTLEWFATPAEMCATVLELAELASRKGLEPIDQILSINPGLPQDAQARWDRVWFKGGSEPGVLALVYRLRSGERDRAVVVLANDPDRLLPSGPEISDALQAVLASAARNTA
jgi:hypothetical protein